MQRQNGVSSQRPLTVLRAFKRSGNLTAAEAAHTVGCRNLEAPAETHRRRRGRS
jgi:hypothetical protein